MTRLYSRMAPCQSPRARRGISLLEASLELLRIGTKIEPLLVVNGQVLPAHVLEQLFGAAVMGDQLRMQPAGRFVIGNGLLLEPQPGVDVAPIEMHHGALGCQSNGLAEVFDGPVVLADHVIGQADVRVGRALWGSSSRALSRSLIARSYCPRPLYAAPRFRYAVARFGSSSIALFSSSMARWYCPMRTRMPPRSLNAPASSGAGPACRFQRPQAPCHSGRVRDSRAARRRRA